jgi:hypothetical protein
MAGPGMDRGKPTAQLAEESQAAWEALKAVQEAAWERFDQTVTQAITDQLGHYAPDTRDILDVIATAGEQYLMTVQAEQRIYMSVAKAANRSRGLHHA